MRVRNWSARAIAHPCVAHRGWSGGAPENTLAAFRLAMSEPAVQWIELDVHLSKDEVPVVIHDGTLQRTTNARGKVRDRTARELAELDAGSWFHPVYAGEPVPTLEQALVLIAGRCRLNVELKDDGSDGDRLARRTTELIRAMKLEYDAVITSFQPRLLAAARKWCPGIVTGLITDKRPPDLIAALQRMGAGFLSIAHGLIDERLLEQARAAAIPVMAWTVDQPRDLRRLAAMPQPFLLCTNYPDRWLDAVRDPEP